jgi:hypothetical protein
MATRGQDGRPLLPRSRRSTSPRCRDWRLRPPPLRRCLNRAVSADTAVTWAAVPGASGYRVRWRRNDKQDWTDQRDVAVTATMIVLKDVIVDGHFIGVSALFADGAESLVTIGDRAPRRR